MLTFLDDTREAEWLLPADVSWARAAPVLWFGPASYAACVRVLQHPDPREDGRPESEPTREELDAAPGDLELLSRTVAALDGGASGVLHLLLWEGWPYQPRLPDTARFDYLGLRRYALVTGRLDEWAEWVTAAEPFGRGYPPAFVWPADRSWCSVFDVDSHFAGVGCSADAAARLLRAEGLTTVRATWGEPVPFYH